MQRTPTHPALGFLVLGALLVSSPTTPGQSCSFKPVLQGRVCTKPGAPCKPPTVGSGNVGKCTTEGLHPEELACECQGSPTPSYNITLSPLSPTYIDTDVATRSEEHTSELQSHSDLVCRLLLEKKKKKK